MRTSRLAITSVLAMAMGAGACFDEDPTPASTPTTSPSTTATSTGGTDTPATTSTSSNGQSSGSTSPMPPADSSSGQCEPQCDDRSCGVDPVCNESCGRCPEPDANDQHLGCVEDQWFCARREGFYDVFGSKGTPTASAQIGIPLELDEPLSVHGLGLIGTGAGSSIHMAVYTSDAQGLPDALVTSVSNQPVFSGHNDFDVAPFKLMTGTHWVFFHADTTPSSLTRTAGPDHPTVVIEGNLFEREATFPKFMGSPATISGYNYNVYLIVGDTEVVQ
ncbi:MAG: hypothetical protein K0V04_31550 [Deltaproteobacteria bacterium]|nr:hypothetical protein [Deltaproteobacteria bacterium]